jgi:signal transduction histidine kinase
VSYQKESDKICIQVSDNGIGIDRRDHLRIFERFVQADSSPSRKYNGTGLGLTLAKEYIEMHRGTIAVESELGQGSTFTVLIPRHRDERETGTNGQDNADR